MFLVNGTKVNHVIIEKKVIIFLCALYFVGAFFFVAAHYGLYSCYKQIIVYHQMRLRALAYKRAYEAAIEDNNIHAPCTFVKRASHYLIEPTNEYLKGYGLQSGEQKADTGSVKRMQMRQSSKAMARKNNRLVKKRVRSLGAAQQQKSISSIQSIFRWPLKKNEFWLSSFFGPRRKPDRSWGFHYGIDMAALKGTLVYPAARGTVLYAGFQRGYGNTVLISHSQRYTTRYAHLDTICTFKGAAVHPEKVIGTVGDTGYTITRGRDASHLHFEVADRGKQINPLPLLP